MKPVYKIFIASTLILVIYGFYWRSLPDKKVKTISEVVYSAGPFYNNGKGLIQSVRHYDENSKLIVQELFKHDYLNTGEDSYDTSFEKYSYDANGRVVKRELTKINHDLDADFNDDLKSVHYSTTVIKYDEKERENEIIITVHDDTTGIFNALLHRLNYNNEMSGIQKEILRRNITHQAKDSIVYHKIIKYNSANHIVSEDIYDNNLEDNDILQSASGSHHAVKTYDTAYPYLMTTVLNKEKKNDTLMKCHYYLDGRKNKVAMVTYYQYNRKFYYSYKYDDKNQLSCYIWLYNLEDYRLCGWGANEGDFYQYNGKGQLVKKTSYMNRYYDSATCGNDLLAAKEIYFNREPKQTKSIEERDYYALDSLSRIKRYSIGLDGSVGGMDSTLFIYEYYPEK